MTRIEQMAAAVRPLHIALAHEVSRTKVGSPYMATLNKLFQQLPWAEQTQCRRELVECRRGKRGERLAQVV
jgi:hypothetical protein